jgi:hypothetical protein
LFAIDKFKTKAVIPAKAGIHFFGSRQNLWTPAFAGATTMELSNLVDPPAELGVYLNESQVTENVEQQPEFDLPVFSVSSGVKCFSSVQRNACTLPQAGNLSKLVVDRYTLLPV